MDLITFTEEFLKKSLIFSGVFVLNIIVTKLYQKFMLTPEYFICWKRSLVVSDLRSAATYVQR